jgi:hypothetical protein
MKQTKEIIKLLKKMSVRYSIRDLEIHGDKAYFKIGNILEMEYLEQLRSLGVACLFRSNDLIQIYIK